MASHPYTPISSVTPTTASRLNYWDQYYPMPTFTPSKPSAEYTCHKTRYGTCGGAGWNSWSEGKRAGIIIVAVVVAIIVVLSCNCCSKSKDSRERERSEAVTSEELRNEQFGLDRAIAEQQYVERSQIRAQTTTDDVPPPYQDLLKHEEPPCPPAPTLMRTERATQVDDNLPNGWPPTYMQAASSRTITQPGPAASSPSRRPYPTLPSSP